MAINYHMAAENVLNGMMELGFKIRTDTRMGMYICKNYGHSRTVYYVDTSDGRLTRETWDEYGRITETVKLQDDNFFKVV